MLQYLKTHIGTSETIFLNFKKRSKFLKKVAKKAKLKHRTSGGVLISYLKDKNNINKIKSINIKCDDKEISNYRLCVDEEVDLILMRNIYKHFYPNIYFYGFYYLIKKTTKQQSTHAYIPTYLHDCMPTCLHA